MTRDLRRYARETNVRLFAGFLLILFVVGIGLIYIFYGWQSAVMGIICLISGLSPLILIAGALFVVEWIAKKAQK
ncbi:MAG: hypothetical protein EHM41_07390 [Chloroflexi bacterium]|nr:MAG: hypothetical protein EHM41_07390 [Chloroflexota bacterium]